MHCYPSTGTNLQVKQLIFRLLKLVGCFFQFVQSTGKTLQFVPQMAMCHVFMIRHGYKVLRAKFIVCCCSGYLMTVFRQVCICMIEIASPSAALGNTSVLLWFCDCCFKIWNSLRVVFCKKICHLQEGERKKCLVILNLSITVYHSQKENE